MNRFLTLICWFYDPISVPVSFINHCLGLAPSAEEQGLLFLQFCNTSARKTKTCYLQVGYMKNMYFSIVQSTVG